MLNVMSHNIEVNPLEKLRSLCKDEASYLEAIRIFSEWNADTPPEASAPKFTEGQYRQFMEKAADAIFIISANLKFTEINTSCCELTGYSREELLTMTVEQIVPQEDLEAIPLQFDILKTGQAVLTERRLVRKNQTPVWVEISSNMLPDGTFHCIVRDISDRREMEIQLHQQDQLLRQVVDTTPNFIYVKNREGQYIFANKALAESYGTTVSEMLGKKDHDFNPYTEEVDTFLKENREILDSGEPKLIRKEEGTIPSSGQKRWFQTIKVPMEDEEGSLTQLLGVVTDITVHKELEDELQVKNEELNSFIYQVTHDLRTPLSSIIGLVDLAMIDPNSDEITKLLDMIGKSARKLDENLLELLQYTKIKYRELQVTQIDPNLLISEVLQDLEHGEGFRNVSIFRGSSIRNPFQSDPLLITSVVQNLVANAVNYRDPLRKSSEVKISVYDDRQGIEISVEDNGLGIPKDKQERIFNMFFRAHRSRPGSGLGLYIVQKALKKLKGEIKLESEEGVGSKFSVYLPTLIK